MMQQVITAKIRLKPTSKQAKQFANESNDLKYNATYNEPHWLPVTLISRDQLDDVVTKAMLNIL